ncbi:MAG: GAF domain-containing protein [Methylococcales bacterium]
MKTFIKITEIWVPDKERTRLELSGGLYGPFREFRMLSQAKRFEYDEGLPGKAWALGHPLVLTEFDHSYFQRTEAAKKIGLTSGIALPLFSGQFLMAVVVFLCGDDEEHAGAIEAWGTTAETVYELGLIDGYYGTLIDFEWISKRIKMMRGFGLPGRTWEARRPLLIENLGSSESFVRPKEALQAGITTGLGIPCLGGSNEVYVMTFLSAKKTPIAHRIEIWVPNESRERLVFQSGYCDQDSDLHEIYAKTSIARGHGLLGRAWRTGIPSVFANVRQHSLSWDEFARPITFDSVLAMPVIDGGRLTAVVGFFI